MLAVSLFFSIHGYGQIKRTVSPLKALAFYQLKMPGTIMADENGNPVKPHPSWLHYIIIEAPSKYKLVVDSLIYNGIACSADTSTLGNNDWIIKELKNKARKDSWPFLNSSRKWLIQSGCNGAPVYENTLIILKLRVNGKATTIKFLKEKEEVLAEAM